MKSKAESEINQSIFLRNSAKAVRVMQCMNVIANKQFCVTNLCGKSAFCFRSEGKTEITIHKLNKTNASAAAERDHNYKRCNKVCNRICYQQGYANDDIRFVCVVSEKHN